MVGGGLFLYSPIKKVDTQKGTLRWTHVPWSGPKSQSPRTDHDQDGDWNWTHWNFFFRLENVKVIEVDIMSRLVG